MVYYIHSASQLCASGILIPIWPHHRTSLGIASSRKSDAVRTLEEFMALRPDLLS